MDRLGAEKEDDFSICISNAPGIVGSPYTGALANLAMLRKAILAGKGATARLVVTSLPAVRISAAGQAASTRGKGGRGGLR